MDVPRLFVMQSPIISRSFDAMPWCSRSVTAQQGVQEAGDVCRQTPF